MSGGEIEKISGLKKNTYTLLKSLERKKLVLTNQKSGKRYYQPSSPDTLMVLLTEQRRSVLQTQTTMEAILPDLMETYRAKVGRPIVQYYSGITGLRTVFEKVYSSGKDLVWGAFGNEEPSPKFFEEIVSKYEPLRVKRGIKAITISPDGQRARELEQRAKENLKEKYLVDA
jgi:sugar-specific transcriptional regulator TrmB